ncbi:MAG: hypothetical protein RJQ00_00240 [Vicingaceae bacterium]
MKLNTIDLHHELRKGKQKAKRLDLISEVNSILEAEKETELDIENRIINGKTESFPTDLLTSEHVFDIEQIKALCLKYRLRFLDSKSFKGQIPTEAVLKIKALEKEYGISLEGFKIVAPKQLFQLEDKDSDPLLFLQLPNNKFYFIHKWGGELNRFRALLAWPMKKFMNMFWFLLAFAFVFTLAIPTDSIYLFSFLFVHSFIATCGIACLVIFTARENFSEAEWDSKYLS